MKNTALKNLYSEDIYFRVKFKQATGRYITNKHLDEFRKNLSAKFEIEVLGSSVQDKPISMIRFGEGKIKVLAWSQMHGNEGTTTKAIFDLLNSFQLIENDPLIDKVLQACSFFIIPVLNPDGAEAYTRINANKVDLNRDMQNLSQPESRILMSLYRRIQPDYCLNLHDQRTIFSAGEKPKPATLSFLTPSKDKDRSIDPARKISMSLIAGIAADLKKDLNEGIGRYDDGFNINCAGDTFQSLSTPTLLFEAGHFPGDYEREKTREYVFRALLSCLYQIASGIKTSNYQDYFEIPENREMFNDVIIRNALLEDRGKCDIAIQFKEMLTGDKVEFVPEVESIAAEISKFGHREIDAEGQEVLLPENARLNENVVVNKIIINSTELEVKYV
ncbi:M14 family zinc carboxypeptidase [Christiangramia sabulilitoris]|uniref:DUF2817 domain-containing protein n=1 Tax=Christiangramia sabulilitoris TaxID=2583991 RepID=A0A550I6G8_9FLAO|nr:M14 family zinc carboxypeptidase [Christiangramia sabulilitoris]TRO66575.1 DUF2817 domain-containing protein [Christiangramia sabulilitoris]